MSATVLNLAPIATLDDEEQFIKLCEANPHLRLERDATGALVVMPPSGGEGSRREVDPLVDLGAWNRRAELGIVLGPTAMFKLPTGPWRCPDAAWIARERWESLTPREQRGFLPLAPDFVIEVRSPSDSRTELEGRVLGWIEAGVRLAWLLDPDERIAMVFRQGGAHEEVPLGTELSGDPVLPGFRVRWRG
jgi:Uma2 family endonuclease